MALTPKQQRFVDEYLIDLNATQAAIRAGYSAKTAGSIGEENLKKPDISAAIAARQATLQDASHVTQERVIRELALVGFADLGDYMTWNNGGVTLAESTTLDADKRRAVAEVQVTFTAEGGSLKLKLHSKLAALDKLARHLGLLTPPAPEAPPPGHQSGGLTPEYAEHLRAMILGVPSNGHAHTS
jgi:phage terminase small subunit